MKRATVLLALMLLAACGAPAAEPPGDVAQSAPSPSPTPAATAVPPTEAPATVAAPPAALLVAAWDETLGDVIRAVDPVTGEDAPDRAPVPFGRRRDVVYAPPYGLSADGRLVAVFETEGQTCWEYAGGTAGGPRAERVHLLDGAAWRARVVAMQVAGWPGQMAFSAEGNKLAVALQTDEATTLVVIDVAPATVAGQAQLPFAPRLLGFTDAGHIVAYGQPEGDEPGVTQPEPPQVILLDGVSLAPLWETTLDNVVSGYWCSAECQADHGRRESTAWTPGVVLAPGGHMLLVVHADEDRLTTVDLDGQSVRSLHFGAPQTWLERLLVATAGVAHAKGAMNGATRSAALSPDGTRLYVAGYTHRSDQDLQGNWTMTEEVMPLQVVDSPSGRVVAQSEYEAQVLHLAHDGARLLLHSWAGPWPATRVVDALTLETLAQFVGPTVRTTVDREGRLWLVGQKFDGERVEMSVIDPSNYRTVAKWTASGPATWLGWEY